MASWQFLFGLFDNKDTNNVLTEAMILMLPCDCNLYSKQDLNRRRLDIKSCFITGIRLCSRVDYEINIRLVSSLVEERQTQLHVYMTRVPNACPALKG